MKSSQAAMYDMRTNPVYQIDCQLAANGKRVALSKRRIQFKFGFSNAEAIASGQTGPNCRGAEHEVVIVWSVTSGKQIVLADGLEVHFANTRSEKLESSWTMKGGHQVKVLAYAAPPLRKDPGFRQFDLFIDGLSYWDMPKMYELGTSRGGGRAPPRAPRASPTYSNYALSPSSQGEAHFSRPPSKTSGTSAGVRRSSETVGLSASTGSLRVEAAAAPVHHAPPPRRTNSEPEDMLSTLTPVVGVADLLDVAPQTLASPTSVMDEFTPVAPEPYKPTLQTTFQDQANQILTCYAPQTGPSYLALANESHTGGIHPVAAVTPTAAYGNHSTPFSPQASRQNYNQSPQSWGGPATHQAPAPITPTMAPLSYQELTKEPDDNLSPMEKAINSLVNLEDISQKLETPEQKRATEKREANQPPRNKPKPPTTPQWHLGQNASLADIKSSSTPKQPAKEVMRTHAFDPAAVQAGMMVVYGASNMMQQQQQLPGGIPYSTGFGAGVHASHYGAPRQYYGAVNQPMYAGH